MLSNTQTENENPKETFNVVEFIVLNIVKETMNGYSLLKTYSNIRLILRLQIYEFKFKFTKSECVFIRCESLIMQINFILKLVQPFGPLKQRTIV